MLIREAAIDDCKLYFNWVNDEGVRSQSFNSDVIIWDNHQNWFENKLKNNNSHLFVCVVGKDAIGQVRFDLEKDYYIIDYSIDKNFRGKGHAFNMLLKSIDKLREVIQSSFSLKAEVKKGNFASLRVFEKLGMNITSSENEVVRFEKYINW